MKHPLSNLLLLACSLFPIPCSLLSAAVPLKWTVETSRAVPAAFEAYQGETLAFEATLQSYGKPLEAPLNYSLYWQTNGMGSTYWVVPCTGGAGVPPALSNVLYATWSPTNDVGARVYNCFIGQPGTIYHAAFQLRLRPSPGANPNELPLPTPVIDFDRVTVLHPPWPGIETFPPIVSNTVTKSYVEGLGITGGIDTNAVADIANAAISTNATVTAKADRAELADYLPLSGGVSMTGGFSTPEIYVSGRPHPYGYRMPGLKIRAYEEGATDSVEIGYAEGNVVLHNPELEPYPFPSGTKIPVRADATVALRSDIANSEERMMAYASQQADNRLIVTNQYGDRIGWNPTYPRVLNLPADTRIGSTGQPSVGMSPYAITVWTNGVYASIPDHYYAFPTRSGYIAIKEEVDEAIESLASEVERAGIQLQDDIDSRYKSVTGLIMGLDPRVPGSLPFVEMYGDPEYDAGSRTHWCPTYFEMLRYGDRRETNLVSTVLLDTDGIIVDHRMGSMAKRIDFPRNIGTNHTTFATLADFSPSNVTFSNAVMTVTGGGGGAMTKAEIENALGYRLASVGGIARIEFGSGTSRRDEIERTLGYRIRRRDDGVAVIEFDL